MIERGPKESSEIRQPATITSRQRDGDGAGRGLGGSGHARTRKKGERGMIALSPTRSAELHLSDLFVFSRFDRNAAPAEFVNGA